MDKITFLTTASDSPESCAIVIREHTTNPFPEGLMIVTSNLGTSEVHEYLLSLSTTATLIPPG
jgi:hypothetical protein